MSVIDEILKDFPFVNEAEWKTLFLKETKQNEWKADASLFGFEYFPFYSTNSINADLQSLYANLFPNYNNGWNINREIKLVNESEGNKKALLALNEGVSSLTFVTNNEVDFTPLLSNISYTDIEVNYKTTFNDTFINNFACKFNADKAIHGALYFDPIGLALQSGGWSISFESDCAQLITTHKKLNEFTNLKYIAIDAGIYHYAGANYLQSLTWTISQAIEYFNFFKAHGISPDEINEHVVIEWPVGLNFFADIALIRALRLLWNHVMQFITGNKNKFYQVSIHAHTSINYWSIADKNTNMLRATTQAFAAVAGGINSLTVYPFDYLTSVENNFSNRIASNVQLLLREESFLSKVNDPAGGSGLVEQLTLQFFENALKSVKEIEKTGGLLANVNDGILQSICEQNQNEFVELFKNGKIKVLGLNLFADKNEDITKLKCLNDFIPVVKINEFKPFHKKRIVGVFEKEVLEGVK